MKARGALLWLSSLLPAPALAFIVPPFNVTISSIPQRPANSYTTPSNLTATLTTVPSSSTTTTWASPPPPPMSVSDDAPAMVTIRPPQITDPVPSSECIELDWNEPYTVYEVKHTATVTFVGREEDYTPPYDDLVLPSFCHFTTIPAITTATTTDTNNPITVQPENPTLLMPLPTSEVAGPRPPSRKTVTIVTTDKNPAVIFTSRSPPKYAQSGIVGRPGIQQTDGPALQRSKAPAITERPGNGADEAPRPSAHPEDDIPPMNHAPRPTFVVSVGIDKLVINKSTFDSLRPGHTSTVVVDEGTFTINPTAVIGEGATVSRPAQEMVVPRPTGTILDGLPVMISGSQAVIDKTTLMIPATTTTTIVNDKTVFIGPDGVLIGSDRLGYFAEPSPQKGRIIIDGTTITAIGSSILVVHSTTITYGSDIPSTFQIVDGDTISIGPGGVIVHGKTLGGNMANGMNTAAEVVGGVTIVEIGPSAVLIEGVTFTLGPDASEITTVIHDKTLTIGPRDIRMSTDVYSVPFGSGVMTTIHPTPALSMEFPVETGSRASSNKDSSGSHDANTQDEEEDDDSPAAMAEPHTGLGLFLACLAFSFLLFI